MKPGDAEKVVTLLQDRLNSLNDLALTLKHAVPLVHPRAPRAAQRHTGHGRRPLRARGGQVRAQAASLTARGRRIAWPARPARTGLGRPGPTARSDGRPGRAGT